MSVNLPQALWDFVFRSHEREGIRRFVARSYGRYLIFKVGKSLAAIPLLLIWLSGCAVFGLYRCIELQREPPRGLGRPFTVHGFRSAFRDWAAEQTGHASEVIEMALAHSIRDKTEAAYRRGDLLDKRRALMRDWADHLLPE